MRFALAFAFLVGVTGVANAQVQIEEENTNIGTSSAEFLQFGAGARGMALGGSFSALARDVEALYYNPAGLPLMDKRLDGVLTVMPYFADTDYYWLGLAFPFAAGQYAIGLSFGNFGFSDQLIFTESDPGTIDPTTDEITTVSGQTYGVSESVVGLSFAHAFIDRFTGGVTLKFVQSSLADADASAFAIDVGTNYHSELAGRPIAFAVVIQNLGSQLEHSGPGLDFTSNPPQSDPDEPVANVDPAPARFRAQSFPLPTTFRVGLAYDVVSLAENRVSLAGEFVEQNNTDPSWGFAGEYAWDPPDGPISAALRASYTYQPDNSLSAGEEAQIGTVIEEGVPSKGLDGLAFGGGLTYRFGDYEARFDYTFRHFGVLGTVNVFSLGFALR